MSHEESDVTRRVILRGAALGGVALPLLAACGSDTEAAKQPAASDTAGDAGMEIASTADVPVGGGTIFADEEIVVTQPTEGEFKAFTAVCTHAGCTVTTIKDRTINCPCHGSMYSIEDGSVVGGPAPAALAELTLTLDGDSISVK